MLHRKWLPIILLIVLALVLVLPTFAQDTTPEPLATVQATLNGNPVEATLVPVGTPAPVEQAKPFDVNVVLPYLGAALVVAVLGIIAVAGTGLLLLFRSTPAAQFISKTVLPPLGDAGVSAYETYAKLTPQPWDDDLAVQLRAEWEEYKKQMTADIEAMGKAQASLIDRFSPPTTAAGNPQ